MSSERPHSRPLVAIAILWSAGIAVDWYLEPPFMLSMSLGLLAWMGSFVLALRPVSAAVSLRVLTLWSAVFSTGMAWHEVRQRWVSPNDVSTFASMEPTLVRLEGRVIGDVVERLPDPADLPLTQRATVRCRFLLAASRWVGDDRPVTGQVWVYVDGPSAGWRVGDEVSLIGWLARPRPPSNQGEADYRSFLASQHVRAVLFTEGMESVVAVPREGAWWKGMTFERGRDFLRIQAHLLMQSRLSPESARLAEGFLLGIRSAQTPSDLLPFQESGTIHVLVVSGLHVALISRIAWGVGTFLIRSVPTRAWVTMLFVLAYTLLTGANPPAVRAAVVSILVLGQFVRGRSAEPLNVLAASTLAVLFLDPADLFRTGPQLSFLCALAILLLLGRLFEDPSTEEDRPSWHRSRFVRYGVQLAASCVVLWLVTAPLIACEYHLFSPISVLASIVLVPMSEVALSVGIVFLALGELPVVGTLLGWGLEGTMQVLASVSERSAEIEPLSQYLSGPSREWVYVWYGLFFFPWLMTRWRPLGRAHVLLLFGWIGIGAFEAFAPNSPREAMYLQLSVGHGNAGILRTKGGKSVLFDCGSVNGPEIGPRVIAPWLWHAREGHLDAVVLSHPDIDHFNALSSLARRFSIGVVFVPPSFLSSKEPGVHRVLGDLWQRGIPVECIWENDRLSIDDVTVHVLHPPALFEGDNDNAESLVLRIEHRMGKILLTGDVEGNGLRRLTSFPPTQVTVLIAPHHGSPGSNTPELARWCEPRNVISSEGHERRQSDPLAVYRRFGARTLSTETSGEVAISFREDGLETKTFLPTAGFERIPTQRAD